MRLIDADKLQKRLDKPIAVTSNTELNRISRRANNIMQAMIDEAETVNVMPSVRGKWIFEGKRNFVWTNKHQSNLQKEALGYGYRTMENIRCSACMKITMLDDTILYEFCPHCGARMEM